MSEPYVALSEPVADEVRKTTCYMCACRCGIDVHLKDGKIRYIEGNRDHPVNRGVLCAKGSAGIMQHYAPARLSTPLLRTGPRGSGEFQADLLGRGARAGDRLAGRRRAQADPRKLAFFTGRDQSQSLTGFWAQQFGTPELRRAWRLLLGQHGGRRHHDHRRRLLGVRRAGLGPHQALRPLRRRRGP